MQNSDGRFELIAAGSGKKIYTLAEQAAGRSWNACAATGKQSGINLTHSVFVAGNTNDGRLQVFATDDKGRVYSNWQQAPGAGWQSRWSEMESRDGLELVR